ncbi:MAG TPA: hypothetical protein VL096_09815 [Pirellulaceae bacterium]|nr:hypothetical protein [Pirellulaceae bacterium]
MATLRNFIMLRIAVVAFASLLVGGAACAQEAQPEYREVLLQVTPAAEPRPALLYSLWTPDRELKAGNSAPYYYRAMLSNSQRAEGIRKAFPPEKINWLEVPLRELPLADVERYIEQHEAVLLELTRATECERCDWELRLKDLRGLDTINFLLHDFQEMRNLSRLIAYKARAEIAQKKFDDAARSLRMGYRIAHDVGQVPLLINGLIGVAISATMDQVVVDWINTPDAPNLYWAIKQLPHPLINMRAAMQYEMNLPYQIFPFLLDAETKERSSEEWQRVVTETLREFNAMQSYENKSVPAWQLQLLGTAALLKAYPQAKQDLIASGWEAAKVEKLPVAQVVAIQASRSYRYTYQEMFKWSLLPYAEARVRMRDSEQRLVKEGYLGQPLQGKEFIPIASLLLPATQSAAIALARHERNQAVLETLEALRMHAAERNAWPKTLSDVTCVPAPNNPFTAQPFDYRLENGVAVLEETSGEGDPRRTNDRRFRLELLKAPAR